ncbi:ATP binding microtubule motor family protein [Striga hermonthica]|uniref:ATP binding microtubule motor family protein n=1 Tax=Striga hermonthica TaxID=68872 RepID=A0A9N7R926_STRHE|nr:ATP binding microtubule motor family protein [Striga hermonthica]
MVCYNLQLEKKNKELKRQPEVAHSRIDDLLRAIESDKTSDKLDESLSVNGSFRCNGKSGILHSENSDDAYSSEAISDPSQEVERPFAEDSDEICKEVVCIENGKSDNNRTFESLRESVIESETNIPISSEFSDGHVMASPGQVSATANNHSYSLLEQKTIDSLSRHQHDAFSPCASSTSGTYFGSLKLSRIRSCRAGLMTVSSDCETAGQSESTPSAVSEEGFTRRSEGIFKRKQWKLPPVMYGANSEKLSVYDSESSDLTSFVDEIKNEISSNGDEDIPTLGSFLACERALRRERETLSKLIYKRYKEEGERHKLYNEWGISLNSKKRRLQLVNLLWTDTENMDHIRKSAAIVAKLIGLLGARSSSR